VSAHWFFLENDVFTCPGGREFCRKSEFISLMHFRMQLAPEKLQRIRWKLANEAAASGLNGPQSVGCTW